MRSRRSAWRRTPVRLLAALSLGLTFLIAAPASAAAPTFNASFISGTSNAGAFAIYELSVSSNSGTISTVTVDAPTGFSILRGEALVSSITFNGLKISGSTVQTFSFDAWAACMPGPYGWTVNASQKNGTQYVPATATSSVTTPSSCSLNFFGQPTSAVTGHTITTIPYSYDRFTPDTSDPVSVEVLRGDGVRDESFTAGIDLSLAAQTAGGGTLSGTTPTVVSAGLASFVPSINVNTGGAGFGFALGATSSLVPGSTQSHFFSVQAQFTSCSSATPCTTDTAGNEIETQASGNNPMNGNGLASSVGAADLLCSGYYPVSREQATTEYIAPHGATAVVTDYISKDVIHSFLNRGISQIYTCFRQFGSFDALNGPATEDPAHPGYYVGLLAPCKNKRPVAPCEISKNETNSGVGVISYLINSGDPVGRH